MAQPPPPMTLRHVLGQARAITQIERAIAADKLAQAYLFDGPPGVGKHTTARALAAALNCEEDPLGCGRCVPCEKVARDLHPDVTLLVPDGAQIKIDQVRAVAARLAFAPHEGRTRVVIVDEAERMNPSAANAMLKSLEEPRPHTRFILVSPAPHRLLPTIRSRCQRVRFAPLPADVLSGLLRERGADADVEEAMLLADGSPGRALALLEGGRLAERRQLAVILQSAARDTSAGSIFAAAAQVGTDREEIAAALALAHASVGARMREQARKGLSTRRLRGQLRALGRATDAVFGNASLPLTMEHLLFELRALQERPS